MSSETKELHCTEEVVYNIQIMPLSLLLTHFSAYTSAREESMPMSNASDKNMTMADVCIYIYI